MFGIGWRRNSNYYWYDANTMAIMKVSYPLFCILTDDQKGWAKLDHKQKEKAHQIIREYHQKYGVFAKKSTIKYVLRDCKKVKDALEHDMRHLILNVTDNCNMRCKYCTFGDNYPYAKSYADTMMSFSIMKMGMDYFFQHAKNSQKVYISFYGGEPLLNFDLVKRGTEYALELSKKHKKKVQFRITTNFTLVTSEILRFLIQNNFYITVSLNGPKEVHDRERVFKNGQGTFDTIMRNLRLLKRISADYFSKHVSYNVVVTPPFELLKLRDFFNHFPYRTEQLLNISLPNSHDTVYYRCIPNEMLKGYEIQYDKLREDFIAQIKRGKLDRFSLSLYKTFLYRIHHRSVGRRDYMYPNGACIPGVNRCYISTDGIYYPCEKVWERLPIGDVKHGIDKRRVCYIYNRFIEICESQCLDCWANGLCYLCYNRALEFKNGRNILSMEKKAQYCDKVKDTLKKTLILYTDIMEATCGNFFNTFRLSSTDVKDECKI